MDLKLPNEFFLNYARIVEPKCSFRPDSLRFVFSFHLRNEKAGNFPVNNNTIFKIKSNDVKIMNEIIYYFQMQFFS